MQSKRSNGITREVMLVAIVMYMMLSLSVWGQSTTEGENPASQPPQTDGAPQPATALAATDDPGRNAQEMILAQSSGSNPWGGSETKLNQFRQAGQLINKQALSQTATLPPNRSQVLFDAYVNRKQEIQKQRNNYRLMIKTNFDQFQKTRYKSMTYNGINNDFTAFNQGFMSTKRR